jgi:hypothetical protein
MNTTIIDNARQFVLHGFSTLPLQTDGSKQPVGSWSAYCDRYASEHELQQWFGQSQQPCGIGVVTGCISNNLLILDFDHDAVNTFTRFWQDIQQQLPGLADNLVVVATPRPGRQVWLRTETPPAGSTVLAWTAPVGEPAQPAVLIETRGQHAYVVAPGGPATVHPKATPYQFIHGSIERLPQLPDSTVARLLDICRSYSQWIPQHVQKQPGQQYTGEPRPGDIFNQQADLRQLLLDAGWEPTHMDPDGTEFLRRPGKNTPGTSASLGYLRTDDGKPLLFVFSSNAAPFQQHHAYDAFAAYALLKHDGDFSRAATAVRIQYHDKLTEQQQAYHAAVAEQIPDAVPYEPLPINCLPEIVNLYCVGHAAAIGIDVAFVAIPMLSTLAACIGSSRSLYLKRNYTQPATLWTATIAEPSTGKSPGWEAATAPALRIECSIHSGINEENDRYQAAQAAHKQAMAAGTAVAADAPAKPKNTQQFIVVDTTMESLIDVHRNNHKLLLSCDELAGWLKRMDQYRPGADAEQWLSIYNGGSISVNRKQDGYRVFLPRTSISVCGTIQPKVARELLFSERFIGNGFAARVLTAAPPAAVVRWSDTEVDEETDNSMNDLAEQLYLLAGETVGKAERPVLLPCTKDARQAFVSWTNDAADHAEQLQPDLRNSWLKLRPAAGRFALLFSVCKQLQHNPDGHATQPVDLDSMQAGIRLAWWFGKELERNAAEDEYTTLRHHLKWIHRYHPAGIDARTLQQGRRSIVTAEDARRVLQQLVDTGTGQLNVTGLFIPNPVR